MKHNLRILLMLVALCIFLNACSTGQTSATATPTVATTKTASDSGRPSTAFQLTGLVSNPGTFALADLQAFPKVTVMTNTRPLGAHTFGGALLYDILQKASITTDSKRKNDILRKVALVTGTDGYSVGVSLGEIVPKFAGKQVIVAYEEDGKPLPQADGFARLIVPGDQFAGRYVSNIAQIDVRSPGPILGLNAGMSTSAFYLVGTVTKPAKYDLTALKALKLTTVMVQSQDQSGQTVTVTYSGVLLNDLLQQVGVQLKKSKNAFLRTGVVAIGADGYSALIVGGEYTAKFGNIQVLVAFAENGQPVAQSDGFVRLIVPGDHAMGRYVFNVAELQVVDLTV